MRKLASIQVIHSIQPIEGADAIEVASVLGWKVVVKKGDFKVYDQCVYCEIDSILPERPEFEFLRTKHFRIKTVKLRGQVSQGICFPLSILPNCAYQTGQDVTQLLGVTQYEQEISVSMKNVTKGAFPECVPKTDEVRIQAEPGLLDEFKGLECYITQKIDGTSATFVYTHTGEFEACSRNLSLKDIPESVYWNMARKYDLQNKLQELRNLGQNYAIQGEIAGPGIQKNPLGLEEPDLFVFNVYDIDKGQIVDFVTFKQTCRQLGLKTVPVLYENVRFDFTLESMLKLARGKYPSGKDQEGIVIRPVISVYSPILHGRLSVKVINNDYLLKEK